MYVPPVRGWLSALRRRVWTPRPTEDEILAWMYRHLVDALCLAALPADKQIDALPEYVQVTDEIALTFDDAWLRVPRLVEAGVLSPEQVEALAPLDRLFADLSDIDYRDEVWSHDALVGDGRWQRARDLAATALSALGERLETPAFDGVTYVRARDENAEPAELGGSGKVARATAAPLTGMAADLDKRLELAAARYRLGYEHGDSLRALGIELLSAGREGAIRLASADDCDLSAIGPVFERVCEELGQPVPSEDEAVSIVITAHLTAIAHGAVAPETGLRALMSEVDVWGDDDTQEYLGAWLDLEHLVSSYYSYDDLREAPNSISFDGSYGAEALSLLDAEVREQARAWLAR